MVRRRRFGVRRRSRVTRVGARSSKFVIKRIAQPLALAATFNKKEKAVIKRNVRKKLAKL